MQPKIFLHEHTDFPDLIRIVADKKNIIPQLIEKDYWIMHCLHGLTEQGFDFELKGGTSLSKGFNIIHRFSEDIDIQIKPACCDIDVKTGKNQNKPVHIESRKHFYDWLAENIKIAGITEVIRDTNFDDSRYRSGGIRLNYESHFDTVEGIKESILLELGFDDTAPNEPIGISSWAYEQASNSELSFADNRATNIKCYHPGYTFVEKLQTISTKYRQQQKDNDFPINFLRHYYDVFCLLSNSTVLEFIKTDEYHSRKKVRFRRDDNLTIAENEAFLLTNADTRKQYINAYQKSKSLYYQSQPSLDEILEVIGDHIHRL